MHLVFLTVLLNCFQFPIRLEDLYLLRSLAYLSSHYLLKCLVMLIIFELFVQICSVA